MRNHGAGNSADSQAAGGPEHDAGVVLLFLFLLFSLPFGLVAIVTVISGVRAAVPGRVGPVVVRGVIARGGLAVLTCFVAGLGRRVGLLVAVRRVRARCRVLPTRVIGGLGRLVALVALFIAGSFPLRAARGLLYVCATTWSDRHCTAYVMAAIANLFCPERDIQYQRW